MPTAYPPGDPLRRGDPGDWFYTQEWRRSLPPLAAPSVRRGRPILVLASDSPLAGRLVDGLRAEGRPVLLAIAGETCMRGGPDWFVLRPGASDDIEALIETLRAERRLPADVAHLWTLAPDDRRLGALARFERARDRAFRSLLHLACALDRLGGEAPISLHVLSNGAQEVAAEGVLSPLAALAHGACRVAARELSGLRLRCLDLHAPGPETAGSETLVGRVLAELVAEAPDELVALRGRERFVPRFEPLRLALRPASPGWLRERGVYLVTGGLGRLGLAIAEHLARQVRARLVLLDRRGLPPRETWGEWIAKQGELDATSHRIRRIQAAEDLGAEVMLASADATDPESLQAAVEGARARFGAIHGAFHCASLREQGPLRTREPEAAERVLATKVLGALALEDALADSPPDFLFFAASLAGAGGLPDRIEAAAADTCLAALAAERSAAGRPTFCVGFGPWREVGLAAERARAFERGASARPGSALRHPLLHRRVGAIHGEDVLLGEISATRSWLLSEHRMRGGPTLLPPAALLELALAAWAAAGREGPVEVRDLRVLHPLALPAGHARSLRVRLARDGELHVESRDAAGAGGGWLAHAQGGLVAIAGEAPSRPLAEIRQRCGIHRLRLQGALPHAHLELGPRFGCLRGVGFGEAELLAEVELAEAFAADLAEFALHPALLEMATSCAPALIPDFNPVRDFYLPASYARVRVWKRLPGRFACHVRHRRSEEGGAAAVFDATLLDAHGREIAAIDGLAFDRAAGPAALRGAAEDASGAPDGADARFAAAYFEQELHVEEGVAALARLLGNLPPAQLLVAPHPIAGWLEAIELAAKGAPRGEAAEIEPALWELAAVGPG
jgi:NAD(P)-dependent dehydrogenase (short-subunit alcohol dehydrogenase family)